MTSCGHEKTELTIDSRVDSTWGFSEKLNYEFDENHLEVIDGKARLKPLDLEHIGEDLNDGSHVGTSLISNSLSIQTNLKDISTHVNSILPIRSSSLVGYWRIDGD